MPNLPEHIGAFVIVLTRGKVLLGKRKNSYKSDSYGFPCGRLELTESLMDCAKRELLEETSLIATKLEYMGVVRELQDGYNFIHFGFLCTQSTGTIKVAEPDKCEGWEYFAIDRIPQNTLPAHAAAIKLLEQSPSYIELV